jgi:hypothetical protein
MFWTLLLKEWPLLGFSLRSDGDSKGTAFAEIVLDRGLEYKTEKLSQSSKAILTFLE